MKMKNLIKAGVVVGIPLVVVLFKYANDTCTALFILLSLILITIVCLSLIWNKWHGEWERETTPPEVLKRRTYAMFATAGGLALGSIALSISKDPSYGFAGVVLTGICITLGCYLHQKGRSSKDVDDD